MRPGTEGRQVWHRDRLRGEHADHLEEGLECYDCHVDTVAPNNQTIVGLSLHVNGVADLALPPTINRVGGECTGSCHGEHHDERDWD